MVDINGSPFNDNGTVNNGQFRLPLIGTVDADVIRGFDGDDILFDIGGNDTQEGGNGNDLIIDLQGNDSISGGDGNDAIFAGSGHDTVDGGKDNDIVFAGRGNDSVRGGDGNDSLYGEEGHDTLIGDRGSDTMIGGHGNDRLIWNNGDGSDLMNGGSGNDVTEVNGASNAPNNDDVFTLKQENGKAIFDRTNLVPFKLTVDNVEKFEINGRGGHDSLDVDDLSQTDVKLVQFSGGEGNDSLNARDSSTKVEAKGDAGHDSLIGSSVADNLDGGTDNDTVIGGRGNDTMLGGEGHDRLIWNNGDGSDLMNGGSGNDVTEVNGASNAPNNDDAFTLKQENGKAIFDRTNLVPFKLTVDNVEKFEINGRGGHDSLDVDDLSQTDVKLVQFSGGEGNDFLDASDTSTKIIAYGDNGNDTLIGGRADDLLSGGDGSDFLRGDAGNDTLLGGAGNDTLVGGSGSDRITFESNNPFAAAAFGIDTVNVFASGTDKIVLDKTAFNVLQSAAGDGFNVATDFAVVADNLAAATSGAFIVYSAATGDLFYNQNGNAAGYGTGAQFATLAGAPIISANDFIIQA